MVGGRLPLLRCLFTCNAVLLLGVCLYDVEASSCQKEFHKKVGDTVEFSSCLPTAGVTYAEWKFRQLTIAEKDVNVSENQQFKDRLNLNPTNFSLTVTRLTLKDSGDYSFVSETNTEQRSTVIITLQVHEPITSHPVLTSNSTWNSRNESCTFLLECIATSDISVTYKWTVGNQTMSGSRLLYNTRKQDGDTRFTCTVSNHVSEMSTSETLKCSNVTDEIGPQKTKILIIVLGAAVGGCLLIVVVGVAVCVCHSKRSRAGSDANDLTVYADITEVAMAEGTSSTMKPCSVYETIENKVNSPIPKPQTVYDKIQFNRVRETSPSPYQDIS